MQSLQGQKAAHTERGEINDRGMKDGEEREGPDRTCAVKAKEATRD